MNLIKWVQAKLKERKPSKRIYFISNFEVNAEDYDFYVENAKKKTLGEDLNIDIIYGKRHTNIIRTAKYKVYSFIPQVVFFQFLRLGNLYFLSISILQLIPEISDSHGLPTYLIPLFFIIVVAMIKEFFEDWQRHKSDNEENNKRVMVFENGKLVEKTWAHVKDGDVVKVFAYEYFPADLVILNCSNKKGIVNIETKNVDGESNVKHKFCIPKIAHYFFDDSSAGFCRMEVISEPPNDNIFEYEGNALLPPLQYKQDGELFQFFLEEDDNIYSTKKLKNRSKTLHLLNSPPKGRLSIGITKHFSSKTTKVIGPCGINFKNTAERRNPNVKEKNKEEEKRRNETIESNMHSEKTGVVDGLMKRNSLVGHMFARRKRLLTIPANIGSHKKKKSKPAESVPINIDNVVLRGTSLVNTKWIYGLVINTGNRTKLMKNVSTRSRQKWSRLEYIYGNHVIVLIIIQIVISMIVAIGGVLWMQHTGHRLWYLHVQQQLSSIKTFFITVGAMVLLFGSFIPVDLLLIWEVVRLLQGYLINWDDEMYSKHTGKHALSKAGQLLEEMGNVTHIYSDKTGTLTQNVMQLQNIGLGKNGVYGYYDFNNIRDNLSKRKSSTFSIFVDNELERAFKQQSQHTGTTRKKTNLFIEDTGKFAHNLQRTDSSIASDASKKSDYSNEASEIIPPMHAKTGIIKSKNKRYSGSSSLGGDTYKRIFSEDDFMRGPNNFVFFNRVLFANRVFYNEVAALQALYCMLVFSLCHSAMIRNAEIDDIEKTEQLKKGEKSSDLKLGEESKKEKSRINSIDETKRVKGVHMSPKNVSIKRQGSMTNDFEKKKIYDAYSDLHYTYLTNPQPQYDASSPDELALICTSLYLGCEFVNRPDLRTIELELTSTFAQRLILGEEKFEKFIERKNYYETNFDYYFPEAAMLSAKKKENRRLLESPVSDTNTNNNNKDSHIITSMLPLKNIFSQYKYSYKDENECDEATKPTRNGGNNSTSINGSSVNNLHMNCSTNKHANVKFDDSKKEEKQPPEKKVVPILSFEILDVFAFDNIRKRMSIIVKSEKNEIYMLTKGADASVLKMAKADQESMVTHIQYQLNTFAHSGLRTLVLGYKHLTTEEFNKIHINHAKARNASNEKKEETIQKFYDETEKDLIISGCTGIDDKLQDDVPQVIEDLREAGMTICILTGDKLETAINIGHSINILNKNTYNAIFIDTDPDVLLEQMNIHEKNTNAANLINTDKDTKWWNSVKWENLSLDMHSETIFDFMKTQQNSPFQKNGASSIINNEKNESFSSMLKQEKLMNSFIDSDPDSLLLRDPNKKKKMEETARRYTQFAITVTGEALAVITSNKMLKIKFYTLARSVSTLIACRVTPKQKSVLVKENSAFNPKGTSLAIGDGANDVGMILMANVGVGIAGKEGLQAARSSDFTISEFKYLKKLLFVHGRESLRRNSFLVYFCIFRNVSFCLCSMVLIFLTGYSAIDAWNPWTKQIINIAFTSLPVILFVALDKQLPHHILLNNPVLYETTPSTLWPIQPRGNAEQMSIKLKKYVAKILKLICYPLRFIPKFQESSSLVKSWLVKKSKTEKFRSYGTHFFVVYFLYAVWLAVTETLLILFFATGQAHSARTEFQNVDVDFNTFSQILYTHHAIAVNAVVVLMTNTWFIIFHVIFVLEILALLAFWLTISRFHFFLNIVGADDLHGTFENAHSSINYYASLFMTLYVSLLPLLLSCTYQFMKKPTMEQIVSEQVRLGIFEGMRKQTIEKLAYVDDIHINKKFVNYGFAFAVEAKDAFLGIVQKAIDKIKYPLRKEQSGITVMTSNKRK